MRKVLIIDGEQEFAQMVRAFLKTHRFQVECAYDPEQAREKLLSFSPQLIILSRDLRTDSGNLIPEGFGVLKEIKTHPSWSKIPVIFLVNEASERDLERLRKLRYKAEDYARKPIEDNELLRRIENLIGFDPEELEEKFNQGKEALANDFSHLPDSMREAVKEELSGLFQKLDHQLEQMVGEDENELSCQSEAEYFRLRLKEQEQNIKRLRDKWKKAMLALEERIQKLEQENRELKRALQSKTEGEEKEEIFKELLDALERMQKELASFKENFSRALSQLKSKLERLLIEK